MKKKVLIVNGPNINMIGERETGIYGKETIDDINRELMEFAGREGFYLEIYQSNSEGDIIDRLHSARHEFGGIVINAGAYSHYSYAIRDAIAAIKLPTIEVHLSNIFARDEFRATSVISPVCAGVISGFGKYSYTLALTGVLPMI